MQSHTAGSENPNNTTDCNRECHRLIVIEESTKYFSASSAWAQYSDGLEHNFEPIEVADPRQTIEFGEGGTGVYLSFSFNLTNGRDEIDRAGWYDRPKHSTHIWLQLPPGGYEDDYDWQWKISQAWFTPGMKWEWLKLGWKAKEERATLPLGDWDALHCDSMEFYISTISTHRLILKDVTLGVYLPVSFRGEDLLVYRPCGQKSCHIINNEVYCRGFGMPDPLVRWLIVFTCLGCVIVYRIVIIVVRPLYMKIIRMRVSAVDREIIEMSRLRAEAWESNQAIEYGD